MAYGPVNAGGGASGKTMEEIRALILAARQSAETALRDHGEAQNPHRITTGMIGAVPVARKVNGKQLNADITLTAQDVGAAAANHSHSFESLSGKVFHAGTSAPANKGLLWIDTTANTGGLKYYNGSAWVHVPVAYN